MPSVIASKTAEMRRGGLGKKEFIRDPNPVGAHSEKKRTKSKREKTISTGSAVIIHRPGTKYGIPMYLQGYHQDSTSITLLAVLESQCLS